MTIQRPPFLRLPPNVLEDIALYTVHTQLGPPRDILALILTCRAIRNQLLDCSHLYARVFRCKFDYAAARRRLGEAAVYTPNLARQLKAQCITLAALRSGDVHDPNLLTTLWSAFLMMIENDGRNAMQLIEYAGLKPFLATYAAERLWKDLHNGWPQCNIANSLALWLMWLVTDLDDITSEDEAQRKHVMDLVRPFVVNPASYPAFHATSAHFTFPVPLDAALPPSTVTAHGFVPARYAGTVAPHPDMASASRTHYGHDICLATPLASVAAKLIYLARSEESPVIVQQDWPETRAEAGTAFVRPCKDDLREFNAHRAARPFEHGTWDRPEGYGEKETGFVSLSQRFDDDWVRWSGCFDMRLNGPSRMPYTLGALTGAFFGRTMMPEYPQYIDMFADPAYRTGVPMMNIVPTSVTLREYVAASPQPPLPLPGGSAHQRKWWPNAGPDVGLTRDLLQYVAPGPGGNTVRYTYRQHVPTTGGSTETAKKCRREACAACAARRDALRVACDQTGAALRDCERMRRAAREAAEARAKAHRPARVTLRRSPRLAAKRARDEAQAQAQRQARAPPRGMLHVLQDAQAEAGEASGVVPAATAQAIDDRSLDELLARELRRMEGELAEGGVRGPQCTDMPDIMLVGDTVARHAQAWYPFHVRGRVRPWDGLCAFARVQPENLLPTLVYRGYVVGGRYLVGTWRSEQVPNGLHAEGPFILSRIQG